MRSIISHPVYIPDFKQHYKRSTFQLFIIFFYWSNSRTIVFLSIIKTLNFFKKSILYSVVVLIFISFSSYQSVKQEKKNNNNTFKNNQTSFTSNTYLTILDSTLLTITLNSIYYTFQTQISFIIQCFSTNYLQKTVPEWWERGRVGRGKCNLEHT